MFELGPEKVLLIVVVFMLFGGKKLPELGAGLGRGIRDFKRALNGEGEASAPHTNTATPAEPARLTELPPAR
ncbi:MAG: tatA [Gemmatimonadetes bacterium]|nr:tatA [Gemmatimonadota bacterium]